MVDIYEGRAKLADGSEYIVQGTIIECATWADNIIRSNSGDITIDIRRLGNG